MTISNQKISLFFTLDPSYEHLKFAPMVGFRMFDTNYLDLRTKLFVLFRLGTCLSSQAVATGLLLLLVNLMSHYHNDCQF